MQKTLICVAYGDGRWRVTESGPRNSISCFGERRDAIEYASELAQQTGGSWLLVRENEEPAEEAAESREPRQARQPARHRLPLDRKSVRARAAGRRPPSS
jgi:hypothetical protein